MARNVHFGRAMKDPTNFWPVPEMQAILAAARAHDAEELALLFETLWLSGRRIGEVLGTRPTLAKRYAAEGRGNRILLGLCPKHIDWAACQVTWFLEKQAPGTWARLEESPILLTKLADYVKRHNISADKPIFTVSEKMAERHLQKLLQGLSYELNGQSYPVRHGTLHTFRHSHGDYAEKTCGLGTAKYRLQHRSATATESYLHPEHLIDEKLFSGM